MIVGTSFRVDCDNDTCPETGLIPVPTDTVLDIKTVQPLFAAQGWYLSNRGCFCYRHKPRDWDGADAATPPELKGVNSL